MRKLRLSVLRQLMKPAVSKLPPHLSGLYINHNTLFLTLFRSSAHQESLRGRFLPSRDWDIGICHMVNLGHFCLHFLRRKRELTAPGDFMGPIRRRYTKCPLVFHWHLDPNLNAKVVGKCNLCVHPGRGNVSVRICLGHPQQSKEVRLEPLLRKQECCNIHENRPECRKESLKRTKPSFC